MLQKIRYSGWLILLFAGQFSHAQTGWTLQKCIEHALANNLTIKQGQLAISNSEANLDRSKQVRIPSVAGFSGYNYNSGRNINPITNTFTKLNVQSMQFGMNAQVTLFNGLQNTNTIKMNQINSEVSIKDLEVISNNITLQVATSFLQILFSQETLNSINARISSTESQLETAKILFEAGNTNQSSVFELEAKLANDKLDLVNAQNNLRLNLLSLANLLQVPFDDNFKIESPKVNIPAENITDGSKAIYDKALKIMPEVELSILKHKAALVQYNIAKGAYYPTLVLSANMNTLFSDQIKDLVNPQYVYKPTGFYVQDPTGPAVVGPGYEYDRLETRPFSTQFSGNQGKSIGLSLNVPIYSQGRVRASVIQAGIASEQQKINIQRTENDLHTSVVTAVANYTGAQAKYTALSEAVSSQKKNYDFNKIRFEAGALSSADLVTSQRNFEVAEVNFVQGKFELIFRKVLLDFYRGIPIVID